MQKVSLQYHFKMLSKPLSPLSEPEVLPCFELNYRFLERHKKPLSLATTTDLVRLTLLFICQRKDSFDS